MGITPGRIQIDEGADKGPTYDIVGVETDALTRLNAALKGVDALRDAIFLMEKAASNIISATEDGKTAIENHVTSSEVSEKIEDVTIQAVTTNISLIANQVQTELAKRGYSSTF